MQYQLSGVNLVGTPSLNQDGTYSQYITVLTSIVGQTYTGFQNADGTTVIIPASLTIEEAQALIQKTATEFVAKTYPNT